MPLLIMTYIISLMKTMTPNQEVLKKVQRKMIVWIKRNNLHHFMRSITELQIILYLK